MTIGTLRRVACLLGGCVLRRVWPDTNLIRNGMGNSGRYCYAAWLWHLVRAVDGGLRRLPKVVVELGPGASVGVGLAALISGARRYSALDIVEHATPKANRRVFDEMVELFRTRTPIPDPDEFPRLKPPLASYDFPAELWGDGLLDKMLRPERLQAIRRGALVNSAATRSPNPPELGGGGREGGAGERTTWGRYIVPWCDQSIEPGSVDMVLSTVTMEHVDDLAGALSAMRRWLRPGGVMTHLVDFTSHDTATSWNGHWSYGPLQWRWLRGRRLWFLNRVPPSEFVRLCVASGFLVERVVRLPYEGNRKSLSKESFAKRYRYMSSEDSKTGQAYILCSAPSDRRGPVP